MNRIDHLAAVATVAFSLLASLACSPVYAPPMVGTHFGAPGRVEDHEGHVEATGSAWANWGGGGSLPLPVDGDLRVEARTDARVGTDDGQWTMGSLGLRYTLRDLTGRGDADGRGLYADLEAGVGVGAGGGTGDPEGNKGEYHTAPSAWDHLAGGAYAGAGIGYRIWKPFAAFVRGRAQVSAAERLPTTLWATGVAGVDFRFGPVSLYGAGGMGTYQNRRDDALGWLAEGGLAVRFGTPW